LLVPTQPKIYHIVHVDRLPSIIADGRLWCDAVMADRTCTGTMIGMNTIKQSRLTKALNSYPDLNVGECVPFYFCPRSIMLYLIYRGNNPELAYRGGQDPILHLEADLRRTVAWANDNNNRWVFTSSNARANYAKDYSDLSRLDQIDWDAIRATDWRQSKEGKQAEFLVERSLAWELIDRVGVLGGGVRDSVQRIMHTSAHHPPIEIKPSWYY
jgi:hypothetical protein